MDRVFSNAKERAVQRDGGPPLRLISNNWTRVGRTNDFPLQQPKIIFLRNGRSNGPTQRPLYVLQRKQGKFVVMDINGFGQYESRVAGEIIYIRRLLLETEEN